MRAENINLTMKMPLPVDRPDGNGVIYTKEAFIIKAFEDAEDKPLEVIHYDGSTTVIGIVHSIEYVEDENGDYGLVSASLYHGGTCEEVDFRDGFVTSMRLSSIGISK